MASVAAQGRHSSTPSLASAYQISQDVFQESNVMPDRGRFCLDAALKEGLRPSNLPWKSRLRNHFEPVSGGKSSSYYNIRLDDDAWNFDSKLGTQFERLLSAIEGVTKQVETAFQGLHDTVDSLQKSLESPEQYGSGWRSLIDHLVQQETPAEKTFFSKRRRLGLDEALHPLLQAMEVAVESIKHLSKMLIMEKHTDLLQSEDFQDRQIMLLRMMTSYLKKPAFERSWHVKHGLDHCIASMLFKASHILARTQTVVACGSASKASEEQQEEAQYRRFCKKASRGLEKLAEWDEEKWSEQFKSELKNTCKNFWQLQRMVVDTMTMHQVEVLNMESGSRYDERIMESVESSPMEHFQPVVQFTVFPGFKIDRSILIKPQVYLQPL